MIAGTPPKLRKVTAEAWEGGGFLGHAYGPIIENLARWGLNVTRHAGTSAGAITAMLRALGTDPAAIRTLQESTPWAQFAAYRPPALLRLLATGGWHSIRFARQWIEQRLLDAGMPEGATFAELRRRTGHDLYVGATRYLRHRGGAVEAEPYTFGPHETPDAPVSDAVLASMAVPLFWPPVEVCGWWYADGGVAMNHPLSIFSDLPPEQVLGVRLDTGQEILFASGAVASEPTRPGVRELILANATMLRAIANRTYVPEKLWCRVVRVDVGEESALDFHARPERIERLRLAGGAALGKWLAA